MKITSTLAILSLAGFMGQATAQSSCPAGTARVNNVQSLAGGKTLCAVRNADKWQEFHQGGPNSGNLFDYKRGPTDPVDPTSKVGTWTAANGANSLLTHSYTGGSSYSWLVCQVGASSTYTLVSTAAAGTINGATFAAGQVACP